MLWGARRYPCQCPQCRTQKLCSCRSITMEKLQHTLRIPVSRLARVKSLRHPRPPVRVQPEVKSIKLVLSAQPSRQTSCNICTYASPIHLSSTLVFALAVRTGGGSLELFSLARFLPCGGASPMNDISGREKRIQQDLYRRAHHFSSIHRLDCHLLAKVLHSVRNCLPQRLQPLEHDSGFTLASSQQES